MTDKELVEFASNILSLFSQAGGGSLFLSYHDELSDDLSAQPMPVASAWFVGTDGRRREFTRTSPALALAAAIGREKRIQCRQCKVMKSVECYPRRRRICTVCNSQNDIATKQRKARNESN